jgi:hypothetical protein
MNFGDREGESHGNNDLYPFWGCFVDGAVKIHYETAERANIDNQRFSAVPIGVYADAVYRCNVCSAEFVFTASEQRYWYETRRLYVRHFPRHCTQCGHMRRIKRERQITLLQMYNAQIKNSLRKDAGLELKQEMMRLIDDLAACLGSATESMNRNRAVLAGQIQKRKGTSDEE